MKAEEQTTQRSLEQRRQFGRWDHALDQSTTGPRWLQAPDVAQVVAGSLHYLNGRCFDLDTYCIMPNHVHVIFAPLEEKEGHFHSLSRIMHRHKRYTAIEGNRILGRERQFWQHESFDHIVRDEKELERIRRYVLNNPVQAGLVEEVEAWPWSYCKYWEL